MHSYRRRVEKRTEAIVLLQEIKRLDEEWMKWNLKKKQDKYSQMSKGLNNEHNAMRSTKETDNEVLRYPEKKKILQ